jgi:hypothetical protein
VIERAHERGVSRRSETTGGCDLRGFLGAHEVLLRSPPLRPCSCRPHGSQLVDAAMCTGGRTAELKVNPASSAPATGDDVAVVRKVSITLVTVAT